MTARALAFGLPLLLATRAYAQDVEVIEDETSSAPPASAEAPAAAPFSPALVGGRLQQRTFVDTQYDQGTGEDVVETRARGSLYVEAPATRRLRVRLSGSLDHRFRVPGGGGDVRGEAEARLLDAYADVDLGRLDLRIGQQIVSWGRVDFFPAADFLNPPDLRDGLSTDLETAKVPVPAVRADLGLPSGLAFAVVYEPFFVPARVDLFGSDFALVGPGASRETRDALAVLTRSLDDSRVEDIQDDLLATEVPDEWFVNGQVGARLEVRGAAGAIALSGLSGYEKVPTATLDPRLRDYLLDPRDLTAQLRLANALGAGERVYDSRYHRVGVVALDGEVVADPVLLRFDVGFTPARTFYAVDDGGCALPCAVRSGLVQVAVQAEYTEGETWLLTAELAAFHLTEPPDTGRLVLFGDSRTLPVGIVGVRRSFWDGDLTLSLYALATWAPESLVASFAASYALREALRVEGGVFVFEGWDEEQTLGSLYDPNDAAYAGLRYDF